MKKTFKDSVKNINNILLDKNEKKPSRFWLKSWFYLVRVFWAILAIMLAYGLQINITNYAYSISKSTAYAKQMSVLSTTIILSILSAWIVTLIPKMNWSFKKSKYNNVTKNKDENREDDK